MTPAPRTARAFTLIELVAVMVVIGTIAAIGSMTFQRAAAANSQVSARGAVYAEASAAMDRIIRKLQSTPARTGTNPAVPAVASFTSSTITWDDQSALVYSAGAGTVTLCDVAAGDTSGTAPVLVGNVTAFDVQPIDQSNANLFTTLGVTTLNSTQCASIRRVSVQITLTRDGQSVTLRSRAFTRCSMATAGS